ncbi:MAG: SET domain-containing protein [Actinomycetota bacterium]|nr:SET domain-containing protein [Actinomycetota bacterium]
MDPAYVQRFGLAIEPTDGGFLVIDQVGVGHQLNNTALFVLETCATPATAGEVVAAVQGAFRLDEPPTDLVEACLGELLELGLVDDPSGRPEPIGQPATPSLRVAGAPGVGRGVFAVRPFAVDEVIERCPVIVVPEAETDAVQTTRLGRYVFTWDDTHSAVGLGFGSLYNHSATPNARWHTVPSELLIEFVATEPIGAGDEVLIHYGGGDASADLGFEPLPS